MVDLELYKPKQEILSLSDDELTLWYGNRSVDIIRLIGKTEVSNNVFIYNKKFINYTESNKNLMTYNIETKNIKLMGDSILKSDYFTLKLFKDLFNYEIIDFDSKATQYEPKQKNRFSVDFPIETNIDSWYVKSIDKPKFDNFVWQNIEIEILDIIGPSSGQDINNFINFITKQKEENNEILFEFKIHSLDPTGIMVDEWVIQVEGVRIDFGEFDYSINEQSTIKIIVKPLNCIFNY